MYSFFWVKENNPYGYFFIEEYLGFCPNYAKKIWELEECAKKSWNDFENYLLKYGPIQKDMEFDNGYEEVLWLRKNVFLFEMGLKLISKNIIDPVIENPDRLTFEEVVGSSECIMSTHATERLKQALKIDLPKKEIVIGWIKKSKKLTHEEMDLIGFRCKYISLDEKEALKRYKKTYYFQMPIACKAVLVVAEDCDKFIITTVLIRERIEKREEELNEKRLELLKNKKIKS